MPRLILFGGKGGVGKTTCASAAAVQLADAGPRTLLLSTDPAHSLRNTLSPAAEDARLPANLEVQELRARLQQTDANLEELRKRERALESLAVLKEQPKSTS